MEIELRPDRSKDRKNRRFDICRSVRQRYADAEDFRRIAETFATAELLKLLGVGADTLKRWLTGRANIPWAAFQLAHDHSMYGLRERDAAEGFNRQMLLGLNEALQTRIQWLEQELRKQATLVPWSSANDPFVQPSDPRSRFSD